MRFWTTCREVFLGGESQLKTTWWAVRRLIPYMRSYARIYACLSILMLVDVALGLFLAWFLKNITEAATAHQIGKVLHLVVIGLFVCLLNGGLVYTHGYLRSNVVSRLTLDMKTDLFNHILHTQMTSMDEYHSGDLMSRLTTDVESVGGAAGVTMLNLIRLPLTAVASFTYLLQINWHLSVFCLLFAPVAFFVATVFSRLVRENSKRFYEALGRLNNLVQDSLAGFQVVRAFQLESVMDNRFRSANLEVLNIELTSARLRAGMATGWSITGFVLFLFSMTLGAVYIAKGQLSVASLIAFVALVQQLVHPLVGLAGQFSGLQRSMGAAQRVFAVMDAPVEMEPLNGGRAVPNRFDRIEFRNLCFSYDGTKNVLEDIHLTVPTGSVVALVGPSGAGKSTLFKLLMCLYSPSSGSIYIDNVPVNEVAPSMVRQGIAYVGQETFLFNGTVRENLLYANPQASESELEQASRTANAHEFIMGLTNGYDTEIGQSGVKLSGGQRQRIAIARALLRQAPILLLDEATSALDNETEALVQEALQRLMKGKTTFVIAHRLSTVQHADVIVVMNHGRIVEIGRHDELLMANGLYARLYDYSLTKKPFHLALNAGLA